MFIRYKKHIDIHHGVRVNHMLREEKTKSIFSPSQGITLLFYPVISRHESQFIYSLFIFDKQI